MSERAARSLARARARISDPKDWTRYSLEAGGKYCAVGALQKELFGHTYATDLDLSCLVRAEAHCAVVAYAEAIGSLSTAAKEWWRENRPEEGADDIEPWDVNDVAGHGAVMEMFDLAIENALKEG